MNINKKLVLGALSTLIVPVTLTMVVSCGSKDEDNQKAVEDAKGNVLSVLTNNSKSKASTLKAYEINDVMTSSETKNLSNFHTLLGLAQLDISQLTNFGATITWSASQKDFSDVFTVTFTYSKGNALTTSETEITTVPHTKDDMVAELREVYTRHITSTSNTINVIDKSIPITTSSINIGADFGSSSTFDDAHWASDNSVDSIRVKTTRPQKWDDVSSTWQNPEWLPVETTVGEIALVTLELMKNNELVDSVPIVYKSANYDFGQWDDEVNVDATRAIIRQVLWHEYDYGFIKDGHFWSDELHFPSNVDGDYWPQGYDDLVGKMPAIMSDFNSAALIIKSIDEHYQSDISSVNDSGLNLMIKNEEQFAQSIKTFRNYNAIPPFVSYNKSEMESKMQIHANKYASLSAQGYLSTKTASQLSSLVTDEFSDNYFSGALGTTDLFKAEYGINYITPELNFWAGDWRNLNIETKLTRKSTNVFTMNYKLYLRSAIDIVENNEWIYIKHDSKMTKEWSRDIATLM